MRAVGRMCLTVIAVSLCCVGRLEAAAPAPPVLQKVIACRGIADPTARLACFDASVATLGSSQASGDLVVMDREQIRQTRKSLFGLVLPQLSLFDRHDDGKARGGRDDSEVKEITGTARAVSKNADGGWIVVLEDGARWEQTDSTMLGRFPKPGSTVLIRKGMFDSYKMQIDHGVFVQAHRLN